MAEFEQKVVVVTGASSGIGQAIAEKFSEEGAFVVLFARDKQKLKVVSRRLKQKFLIVSGDVTSLGDIEKLYQDTFTTFGKIDTIVANAGVAIRRHVEKVDEFTFDIMMNTNVKGVFFTVQKGIAYLKDQANIILIASFTGRCGIHEHSVYSATKAAVAQLGRSFAADLSHRHIRVNSISPGFTQTPIFDQAIANDPNFFSDVSKTIPMLRFAKPSEIANAASYLASEKAAYINGIDLLVDGGIYSIMPKLALSPA